MKTFNLNLLKYNSSNYDFNFKNITTKNESLLYPSLRSKSLLSGDPNFWEREYNFNTILVIRNLIKIIFLRLPRILINYFRIIIYTSMKKSEGKKIAFIITRAAGIKIVNSLEDYRFSGLEKNLEKKNIKTIYFVHDNNPIRYKGEKIYIRYKDIFNISELIYSFYYLIKRIKFSKWEADLKINIIQSKILSQFLNFSNYCFFWDFNFQNYPFFIAGYLNNNKLIGSMHGFHNKYHMPWINSELIKHLKIKHDFCNYNLCCSLSKNEKIQINSKAIKGKRINFNKNSIVIIQENQCSEIELVNWVMYNKKKFHKVYIKLRPDRADSQSLINTLNKTKLDWFEFNPKIIEKDEDLFFIGQSSTYLIELAENGFKVIFFNSQKANWFTNPTCSFANFRYLLSNNVICKNYEEYNIFSCGNRENFSAILKKEKSKKLTLALINHHIFTKIKIKAISSLF